MGLARTLAVVCFGLSSGCATIGSGQPVHTDVPVGTGEQEQPSGEAVDVEQSGTSLTLRARKVCNVVETREVARTTTTPRENKSAWADWTLGVGGAALAGAGAVTVIDSGNVSSSDETSRTYNPVGSTGAMVLGVSLIAIGVAGGATALVDVVRANGSDESKSRVSLPGKELRRGVACKTPAPIEAVELALLIPHARGEDDQRVALGRTNSEGALRVDLERVLPDDLGSGNKAYVMRDTTDVGTIDLAPVRTAHEESAWSQLDKGACAEPKKSDACVPLRAFIARYPAGTHAKEAREIIGKASPALEAAHERETWAGIDTELCAKPPANGVESAEVACEKITHYVQRFPDGKHIAEAKAALAKGLPAVKRLKDTQKERERQAELAEKRREQQEAAQEKAALQRECRAKCNVACSRRVNPEMCMSGCIELCVNQGGN